jgi:hypothetical protein
VSITVLCGGALAGPGHQETVAATTAEVRPGVYFTTCDVQSGGTLTSLADVRNGLLRSVAVLLTGESVMMTGNFRRLRDEQNGLLSVISGGSHQGF